MGMDAYGRGAAAQSYLRSSVALHGTKDVVVSARVDDTDRALLVSPGWSPAWYMDRRMASDRENMGRRTDYAGEHLVPDAVGPAVELLFRTIHCAASRDDGAAVELNIGHEAAAGV